MKKTGIVFKTLLYIVCAGIALLFLLTAYGAVNDRNSADYSSYSTGANGVKALYVLSERMGFSPVRFKKPSMFLPDGATLVAVNPDLRIFKGQTEKKNLRKWLWKGNTLILIGNRKNLYDYDPMWFCGPQNMDGFSMDPEGSILSFKAGKGEIIFLEDLSLYTNEGLKAYTGGIRFIKVLQQVHNRKVLFNEYYHGISEASIPVWNVIGQAGRLAVLQILFGLAVLMLVKAKRFGGKVPLPENVKRPENENLFALANIYIKSRSYAAVLHTYTEAFKRRLEKFLGLGIESDDFRITEAIRNNNSLRKRNIEALLRMSEQYINNNEKDLKKLIFIVEKLEEEGREIR